MYGNVVLLFRFIMCCIHCTMSSHFSRWREVLQAEREPFPGEHYAPTIDGRLISRVRGSQRPSRTLFRRTRTSRSNYPR
ncbi:hypothetical protein PENSPDRAFT_163121 [Peniophora sp. CONT]|nr:hypothetical protein PENSPDRAFT_163121 [Peniophora sp. CONT]